MTELANILNVEDVELTAQMLYRCPVCSQGADYVLSGSRYWLLCHGCLVRWTVNSGLCQSDDDRAFPLRRMAVQRLLNQYREVRLRMPGEGRTKHELVKRLSGEGGPA